jgi:hypothetical protein
MLVFWVAAPRGDGVPPQETIFDVFSAVPTQILVLNSACSAAVGSCFKLRRRLFGKETSYTSTQGECEALEILWGGDQTKKSVGYCPNCNHCAL